MLGLFRSHPESFEELLENRDIEETELTGVEEDLGFSLEGLFDEVKKVKSLPSSDLSTLKGRGSATLLEGNDVVLKYKEEPDLAALARNGVYAEMIRNDSEGKRLHGNDFEDFLYTEFVASLAEETVQRTDMTKEDRFDFDHARENYEETREEAIDAVLEGATAEGDEELLGFETENFPEHEDEIKDIGALVKISNFADLDTVYEEFSNSHWLEHGGIRGTATKRMDFEKAAETYQLAKSVIMAREAARQYIERGGGMLEGEEHSGVIPGRFLEPDEDLFRRTMDYLEKAEEAFTNSPLESVEIET